MGRRIGTIFMILGTALIISALSLFLWNRWEDRQAGVSVEKVLPRVLKNIDDSEGTENENNHPPNADSAEMTGVEIDGCYYIGYISIPDLGLELPVMSDWSYPQLKISPCRYSGSAKTDDLVIAAHNYSRHFGNIGKLSVGDAVYFTDMEGEFSVYEVAEIDILSPADVEEMTDSGYALTLFTCTYGGQSRVTVRCDYAKR